MVDVCPLAYFRGEYVPFEKANLSIASSPVLYGLSVYSVFRLNYDARDKKIYAFRIKDHFDRLCNSAKIMGFNNFAQKWDFTKFMDATTELVLKNKVQGDYLVRAGVYVDGILKGTRMHGLPHELSMFVYSTPPLLPKAGARLMVSSWRRTPDNAIPSRAKINGSYVNASLMKQEALLNGYDDAIALDGQGHVTESTVSNIFIVRGGRLITPDSPHDILEGITRDSVIRLCNDLSIEVEQRPVDRSELYLADEIFLSGSSVQLSPVIEVDNRVIGSGKTGPLSQQLISSYNAIFKDPADYPNHMSLLA